MGLWALIGSLYYFLFFPEEFLTMIHYTFSIYFFIFAGLIFYLIAKKGFSGLLETGLEPKKKKKNSQKKIVKKK